MSTPTTMEQQHKNPRSRLRRPFFTNWTTGDVIVMMITGSLVTWMMFSSNLYIALILGAPLIALDYRYTYGRGWWEIWAMFKNLYIAVVLRDKLYVNPDDDHSLWPIRWLRQKRYRRPQNRWVLPIEYLVVEAMDKQYCIILQRDRPYVHLPVITEGSDFSSYDAASQESTSGKQAENLDQVAAETSLKIGVSYVRMTRPVSTYETELFLALNGQPLLFDPDKFELDETMREVALRVQQGAKEIAETQRQNGVSSSIRMAVVAIKRTREMDQAIKNKSTEEELYELEIIELGRKVVEAIAGNGMNVRNPHPAGFGEVCHMMRASYDVTELSFHEGRLSAEIEYVTRDDVHSGEYDPDELGNIKEPFAVLPQHSIVVGDDFVCIDGNWISTFRLRKRLSKFGIVEIQSIYHRRNPAGVWSSMVTAGESISGDAETRTLLYQESLGVTFQQALPLRRTVPHPKVLRRRRELNEQATELSASSLAQQFNDVICVVAKSKKEMEQNRKRLIGTYKANGFKCEVIRGRSRQVDAYLTGTLGVNRL